MSKKHYTIMYNHHSGNGSIGATKLEDSKTNSSTRTEHAYLDSSNKNLLLSGLLDESRGFTMNREEVVSR